MDLFGKGWREMRGGSVGCSRTGARCPRRIRREREMTLPLDSHEQARARAADTARGSRCHQSGLRWDVDIYTARGHGSRTAMHTPFAVGEVFADKYKIERVLGAGGMGIVLAAKHTQLGERVAIKVLLPGALANPEIVTRFLREARTAARIRSEYVARVLDVGALKSGEPYIVMEFLDGSDLSAVLRDGGPMEGSIAVGHVLQACEALAAVHASGIVHRDLKPANLFLTTRNDQTTVIKLIDFGISKVTLPSEDGDDFSTKTATMMGSPQYMAPEQMLSTRSVDARSDIWSLGVILYHLLTGALPFPAKSVLEIYNLIQRGAPLLRSTLPGAPEGLERCIARCLQNDREDRYANIAELAANLATFGPPGAEESVERCARILHVRVPSAPPPVPASLPSAGTPPAEVPVEPVFSAALRGDGRLVSWSVVLLLGVSSVIYFVQRARAPVPVTTAVAPAQTAVEKSDTAPVAASAMPSINAGSNASGSSSDAPATSGSARAKLRGKLPVPPPSSSSPSPADERPSRNDIVNPWEARVKDASP